MFNHLNEKQYTTLIDLHVDMQELESMLRVVDAKTLAQALVFLGLVKQKTQQFDLTPPVSEILKGIETQLTKAVEVFDWDESDEVAPLRVRSVGQMNMARGMVAALMVVLGTIAKDIELQRRIEEEKQVRIRAAVAGAPPLNEQEMKTLLDGKKINAIKDYRDRVQKQGREMELVVAKMKVEQAHEEHLRKTAA